MKDINIKCMSLFIRNVRNNFPKKIISSIVLLLILPILIYFLITITIHFASILLIKVADAQFMNWLDDKTDVHNAGFGFLKILLFFMVGIIFGIINIPNFLVLFDSGWDSLAIFAIVNYCLQIICVAYGSHISVIFVLLLVFVPLLILELPKQFSYKKLVIAIGFLISVYLMCRLLHFIANHYLFDFLALRCRDREYHEYEKTALTCLMLLAFTLLTVMCIGIYFGIFYLYRFVYCFFILSETKVTEIMSGDLDPSLSDNHTIIYTDTEKRDGHQYRTDYIISNISNMRTIVTFSSLAIILIPLMIYTHWKIVTTFFLLTPIVVEILYRIVHAVVISYRVYKNSDNKSGWGGEAPP